MAGATPGHTPCYITLRGNDWLGLIHSGDWFRPDPDRAIIARSVERLLGFLDGPICVGIARGAELRPEAVRITAYAEGWSHQAARLFAADCADAALRAVRGAAPLEAHRMVATARSGAAGRASIDDLLAAHVNGTSMASRLSGLCGRRQATWAAAHACHPDPYRAALLAARHCAWATADEATARVEGLPEDVVLGEVTRWQADRLLGLLPPLPDPVRLDSMPPGVSCCDVDAQPEATGSGG